MTDMLDTYAAFPLLKGLEKRGAGVLLHPTSLPGAYGIGQIGHHAHQFIEYLHDAGMEHWQICPLGPTGYGDSPYQCLSAFAGNPYLIDLESLFQLGLLTEADRTIFQKLPPKYVDYGTLFNIFFSTLRAAYIRFLSHRTPTEKRYGSFEAFVLKACDWLYPYACFCAFKSHFHHKPWFEWPEPYRSFTKAKTTSLILELEQEIQVHQFIQYIFFAQWSILREHAKQQNVEIIGDIPIFVALDSADTWSNHAIFQWDDDFHPRYIAGVPPDYFSTTGQLWGNPVYDWNAQKEDEYDWWMRRIKANFDLFDRVRIDHFRGFESYWAVPYRSKTAEHGQWLPGPGIDFFRCLKENFPKAKLIAEDLGVITPEVSALLKQVGIPGIRILQFAFDGNAANPHLPHNIDINTVLYPGSHDNDTTLGWYKKIPEAHKDYLRRYLSIDGSCISWDMIRACYRSSARLIVIPMQDLLSLDDEARMNYPGTSDGNWQWRMTEQQLNLMSRHAPYLQSLKTLYAR